MGKHIYLWFLSQDSIMFHSLALVEMEIVYTHIDKKKPRCLSHWISIDDKWKYPKLQCTK